ncbi:unnamed protein product, partial [Musa banksii]
EVLCAHYLSGFSSPDSCPAQARCFTKKASMSWGVLLMNKSQDRFSNSKIDRKGYSSAAESTGYGI